MYRLLKGLPITVYKDYRRVFLFVGDWANTTANVADTYLTGYDGHYIFNIGGSEYISVEELVEKILKVIGGSKSKITVLPKEAFNIQNKKPNIERAIKYLGHRCPTTLDEGLVLTYDYMREKYERD